MRFSKKNKKDEKKYWRVKMNLPYLAAFSIFGDLEELLDKREGEFIGSRKKIFLKFLKKIEKKYWQPKWNLPLWAAFSLSRGDDF